MDKITSIIVPYIYPSYSCCLSYSDDDMRINIYRTIISVQFVLFTFTMTKILLDTPQENSVRTN